MKKDVLDLSVVADSFFRRETVFEGMDEQGTDSAKWQEKAINLVENTARWGINLTQTKERKLTDVEYEVQNKYGEQASYLRTVLMIYEAHKNDKPEVLDAFIRSIPFVENNGSVLAQQNELVDKPIKDVSRAEMQSVWAYDWKALIAGQEIFNPTIGHYFDWEGNTLEWTPNKISKSYFPDEHPSVEKDPKTFNTRPKEALVLNFDTEVQSEVSKLLHRIGVERGMKTVNWYVASFPQGVTDPDGNTNLGGEEGLNLEKYDKYRKIYEQIILHEGFHALAGRAGNLSDKDRIEFRNLWLEVVNKFDPLADMKKLFNPDGAYANAGDYKEFMDYVSADVANLNYMRLTDYYFMHLEGFNSNDNVKNYRDELRNGLILLADTDIYKYFWPQEGVLNIDGMFEQIEKSLPKMDRFSKFFANELLENKDAIKAQERSVFKSEPSDIYYFIDKVIPYTLAHIAVHKKDLLVENLPKGKDEKLVSSFVQSWQKRFDRFVRGTATEEMSAELFSFMLLDTEGKIEWGNTKENFDKMLSLLKRNGIAFQPEKEVV